LQVLLRPVSSAPPFVELSIPFLCLYDSPVASFPPCDPVIRSLTVFRSFFRPSLKAEFSPHCLIFLLVPPLSSPDLFALSYIFFFFSCRLWKSCFLKLILVTLSPCSPRAPCSDSTFLPTSYCLFPCPRDVHPPPPPPCMCKEEVWPVEHFRRQCSLRLKRTPVISPASPFKSLPPASFKPVSVQSDCL